MDTSIFRVQKRFESFWKDKDSKYLQSPRFLIIASLWFLSFIILCVVLENAYPYTIIWVSLAVIFWYLLNNQVFRRLHPPTELMILIFISFYAIEIVVYKLAFNPVSVTLDTGYVLSIFHYMTLSFLVLIFGFILIDNNNRRQTILVFYVFIGGLAHHFVFFGGMYLFFFFQIILFMSLFKRTTWLENLSKAELWLYLIFFIALYYFHGKLPITKYSQTTHLGDSLVWVSIPLYVSKVYRLYLLAMIVKAPVILIYNHAALARKLRMSALFQSTVPQFFQFILLLVIVFMFISGWQAQNIRLAIYNTIEQVKLYDIPGGVTHYKIPYNGQERDLIRIPNCYPQRISRNLPDLGVISFDCLDKDGKISSGKLRHCIFSREQSSDKEFLILLQLDEKFYEHITRNLNLLAGSYLYSYSYIPDEWQSRLYNFDFWQKNDRIKVYPFVFNSEEVSGAFQYKLQDISETGQSFILNMLEQVFGHIQLVTGRVFIPVVNYHNTDHYFQMDLVAPVKAQSLSSPMVRMFLLFVGLYILFNIFVLQRVIQFGEQINQIIVRKFSQLQAGIREITTGNLDQEVNIEGEDEFVELAQHFNYMRKQLKNSIEESHERERLDQELKIARDVQFSFLPGNLPDVPGFHIAASLKTAQEVSGDFYDLMQMDENRFIFTIGDVSGKGSSAAFYMAQMMSLLRFSLQFTDKPEDIAIRINEYFTRHTTDRQVFITATIGTIDIKKSRINLVRAGHTPPILIQQSGKQAITELDLNGMAIGLTKSNELFKKQLKPLQLTLKQGDILLLYTDGLTEAKIENEEHEDELYSEERLLAFLSDYNEFDLERLHKGLLSELDQFYRGHPRMDDQTLLLIQRATKPAQSKALTASKTAGISDT